MLKSEAEYEKSSGMRVADGVRELLLAASPDFIARLQSAVEPDPWKFGFAILHKIDNGAGGSRATWTGKPARVDEPGGKSINVLIGMCGFTGAPDSNGVVEIAYGISRAYEGKGYATEAAQALVEFASKRDGVTTICAHTLPEINASTRILEKCGFKKIGAMVDSENNSVWRWERNCAIRTS